MRICLNHQIKIVIIPTWIFILVCCDFFHTMNAQTLSKEPITFHGNISLSIGAFQSNNFQGNQPSFYWILTGNPVLTTFGIPIPASIMISNQTSSISGPFSQFGISPKYKWITLHAGIRSLTLSPFTIGGHTFLGGALEMNPGIFRFAALYGRFQKGRQVDTTSSFSLRPEFKRMGYGFKAGLGKANNYFDIIYFRAKDDTSSLKNIPTAYSNLTPDENMTLGISSKISFIKSLSLQIEAGGSLYTKDIRKQTLTDENASDLTNLRKAFNGFYPVKIGTSLQFAGEAALRYQNPNFNAGISYRRVEPDYKSMGAWFFQTDIQQITANIGFSFNKRKNRIQLNGGIQSDDLLKQKPANSKRLIGGISYSYNPSEKFGIEIQLNNFQFTQENRYLSNDSLRLQQATRFIVISPHWMKRNDQKIFTHNTTLSYQKSDDFNPYTQQSLKSEFVFCQYQWNMQHQKLGYNLGLGLNARINKSGLAPEDKSFGISTNVGKNLLKDKVQVNASSNLNLNLRKGQDTGYTTGIGAGISYLAFKNTRMNLNTYYLFNKMANQKYSFLNTFGGIEYNF